VVSANAGPNIVISPSTPSVLEPATLGPFIIPATASENSARPAKPSTPKTSAVGPDTRIVKASPISLYQAAPGIMFVIPPPPPPPILPWSLVFVPMNQQLDK